MTRFVGLHLRHHRAAGRIRIGQFFQMLAEVRLDLALGFHHEAQTYLVADQRGYGADGEAAGVPDRIQQARPAGKRVQTFAAPGQVIGFLGGGMQ